MLPRLVDGFEAVAVRIKDIGSVVTGIVVQSRTRRAIILGSGRQGCGMECVDLRLAVRHEADMGGATVCVTGPEPEEHAAVSAEALQVRMARRSVLAVVIKDMADPERSQSPLIESD